MLKIKKRDGTLVPFSKDKIIIAINKAFLDVDGTLYETDTAIDIADEIYKTTPSKTFNNGFGSSALLQYGSDNEYSLTFRVSGSGTVYGTYQHAKSTVSLEESKTYVIGAGGYGNVVVFGSNVASRYDQMPGVDISV